MQFKEADIYSKVDKRECDRFSLSFRFVFLYQPGFYKSGTVINVPALLRNICDVDYLRPSSMMQGACNRAI